MGMQRWGQNNPNYRHGGYSVEPDEELRQRFALQECLQRLLTMDLHKSNPTREEMRWLQLVIKERPEWSHDILLRHGFSK